MTHAQSKTPMSPAQAKMRKEDYDERLRIQARVRSAQHKVIDVCEHLLEQITPQPESALSRVAERRQLANILAVHEVCAKHACRRAHACLGEPRECLRVCLPVLGVARFDRLIKQRRRPRRTRS
jgi:hypothetical protein